MTAAGTMVSGNAGTVVVGVADLKVSDDPQHVIVTYALGSCIAVCLYDPRRRAAGMIHFMLPLSRGANATNPIMFADTGIPVLFEKMHALGCQKHDLVVKIVGGGTILDDKGVFKIGQRNHTMVKKIFWRYGLMIAKEDVGGNMSRTVRLSVSDGRIVITSHGQEWEL